MAFGVILLLVVAELVLFRSTRALAARALGVRGVGVFRSSAAVDFEEASSAARPLIWVACAFTGYASLVAIFFAANTLRGERAFDGHVEIVPEKPAAIAGLRESDRITAIDGAPIAEFDDIRRVVVAANGRALDFEIRRDDQPVHLQMTSVDGKIGVTAAPGARRPMPTGRALLQAAEKPFVVVRAVAASLVQMFRPRPANQLTSTVSMVREMKRVDDNPWADTFDLAGSLLSFYGMPLLLLVAWLSLPSRPPRAKT